MWDAGNRCCYDAIRCKDLVTPNVLICLGGKGPNKELVRQDPLWDRRPVDDLEEGVAAIESRSHLFKKSKEVKSECEKALNDMGLAVQANKMDKIKAGFGSFLDTMKAMMTVMDTLVLAHTTVQRGLIFTCSAYKWRAREAEKAVRVHKG